MNRLFHRAAMVAALAAPSTELLPTQFGSTLRACHDDDHAGMAGWTLP